MGTLRRILGVVLIVDGIVSIIVANEDPERLTTEISQAVRVARIGIGAAFLLG